MQAARLRYLLLACVAAGLSFACHQSGLAVFALPGLAWLLGAQGSVARRIAQGVLALGLGLLVALLFGHAYYLTHGAPERVILADKLANSTGFDVGGVGIVFGLRTESALRLSRALVGYDPLIVVLGLCGLVLALRVRAMRPAVIFALLWAVFFLFYESDHVRYLLPLVLLLVFPAGLVTERWLSTRAGLAVFALLAVLPLAQCLRFVHLLRQTDTRTLAEARLEAEASQDTIAIDRYGPEPALSHRALARLATLRNSLVPPEGLRPREERRKRRFERQELPGGSGVDGLAVGELFEIDERAHTITVRKGLESLGADASAVLRSVGAGQLLHVRRRLRGEDYDAFASLAHSAEVLWTIDPRRGGVGQEALLPGEMEFPLTGLWQVERPGPVLRLIRY
jgi:hypothetical protein